MFSILRNFYLRLRNRDAKVSQLQAKLKLAKLENSNLLNVMAKTTILDEFPPDIIFEPWGLIDQKTVDWCKDAIVKTGMVHVLDYITEICVGPDEKTDLMTGVSAVATTQVGVIYLDDTGWMPGWDLPGTILHEAVHDWQMNEGLTGNAAHMEISAYMVQQLFEWRYCELSGKTPRNLFKERYGAIGLM